MAPIPAGPQVRRLLVMVPWLLVNTPVSLDEVAAAFDITRKQAETDVLRAGTVGVPPYGGGDLLDIWLEDDMVHSSFQPHLSHPPKFTPQEGLVVLASGRALLGVVSETVASPLASALAKLETVLGQVPIAVDLQLPPLLDPVREAVEEGRRLHITYYAAWRDELTERDIEPHVAHERNGRWYVEAFDHRSSEMRRFRIDRIRALADTGERFEPVRAEPPPDVYTPGPDAVEVVVDLPVSARWVVESYPVEVTQDGDRLRVTMRVAGEAWLERLLLRVGPEARVVSPPELADVGARAAQRLLARLG